MDRKQIEAEHVIPRYLAGQLSAAEDAAFEQFALQNPDIYRDIERILRFREGLAVLQDQKKLDPLLRPRRASSYMRFAAAAVVLLVVCGALVWYRARENPAVVLATTANVFMPKGTPLIGTYVLVRSRDAREEMNLQLPPQRGVIQLRVLPSAINSEGLVASLVRLEHDGRRETVGTLHGLKSAPDLYVTIYVDSVGLAGGDYEISLAPEAPSGGADTDRFVLRVR
jgi:hypothetical protein